MSRMSSAHVLAGLALFVALGGTAIANDSVRALITGADVRNGSLTGRDVKNRSLTRADLARGVLRRGPAGPQGPAGARGPVGPAGPDLAGATHVRVRGDRTPIQNGAALRAALASITGASATRPYVIQLAPGVYELGDRTLAMKPDVSIVGAGAAATRITGDQGQTTFGGALVVGADRTLLRDVTVANRGDVAADFHIVMAVSDHAAMRIEDAVLEAESAVVRGWVLIATGGSAVDIRDSRLTSDSGQDPSAAIAIEQSDLRIRGSELVAAGQGNAFGLTVRDPGTTAVVENSSIVSPGSALNAAAGTITVGASRIVGTASTFGVTCVASYDGNFAPVDAGCN
jgi:Pectinesterase